MQFNLVTRTCNAGYKLSMGLRNWCKQAAHALKPQCYTSH